MMCRASFPRRGLSLVELMLALTITGMVAAAIASMLAAVTTGTHTRRDNRAAALTGNAMATRIAAYVTPARAFLAADSDRLALWLHDDRQSESVHASEIRWFLYHEADAELRVHFASFPEDWTQAAINLEDREYPRNSDWWTLLEQLEALGWTDSIPVADGITDLIIRIDSVTALDARHVTIEAEISPGSLPIRTVIPATLLNHQPPAH